MFDHEGCGREQKTRESLENEVASSLSKSGWGNRASVIIIEPELENWVFSDSPEVDAVFGWKDKNPTLRSWLKEKGFLSEGQIKPSRPKEAVEAVLRHVRLPRSSSIYARLAERVGLRRCSDQAFLKLKRCLQLWFPLFKNEQK